MKFKKAKLEFDNGCVGCSKSCQFNGLRVDAESNKVAKRDGYGQIVYPIPKSLYGCNSWR
jgi:hypothetical protein